MSMKLYDVMDESDAPYLPGQRPIPRTEQDDIELLKIAEKYNLELKPDSELYRLKKELQKS